MELALTVLLWLLILAMGIYLLFWVGVGMAFLIALILVCGDNDKSGRK